MFFHIFTYRIKHLLRDKELVFWTLLFPLILATLFQVSLTKIMDDEAFEPIPVAVVNNRTYSENENFKDVLQEVSQGEDRLFDLKEASKEDADQLMERGDVKATISLEPEIQMQVRESGISQDIVKSFLENYKQTYSTVENILSTHPENTEKVMEQVFNPEEYVKNVSLNKAEPNLILIYFYTVIAMACFYGSFWGMQEIIDIQADLSSCAARVNLAPVHKMKAFLSSMAAALSVQYAILLILLAYLILILGVDFGNKTGAVFFTTFMGSVAGISFGAFVSATIKKGEGIKTAILIGITMLGSFLSGMMNIDIKYMFAQNVPVLSYINPVNLLTDAYYCLYYYDDYSRFWLNIGALCIFILLFSVGTYRILRRRKYAGL